jgi:hypothetical protein
MPYETEATRTTESGWQEEWADWWQGYWSDAPAEGAPPADAPRNDRPAELDFAAVAEK